MLAQCLLHVFILVIDGGVEAEFLRDVAALLGAAGDADHAATFDPGDLPNDRADGAGGCRDDDCLSGLRLTGVEKAEICGHARHT